VYYDIIIINMKCGNDIINNINDIIIIIIINVCVMILLMCVCINVCESIINE